jgi:ribosomal protein S1
LSSEVEGEVDTFSSHGAFVNASGARCYVPLSGLGDPPPRAAREVLKKGENRAFVVQALDPVRRGIELALPGLARVSGTPTAETVEEEIKGSAAAVEAPAEVEVAGTDGFEGEAPKRTRVRKTTAREPTADGPIERGPVKKTAVKKTAVKKTAVKKTAVKKTAAERAPAEKATARKTLAEKAAVDKAPAKKVASKKLSAKKAPAKRTVARKAAAAEPATDA